MLFRSTLFPYTTLFRLSEERRVGKECIFVEDNYLVVRNNLQKKKFVETSNKRGLHNLRSFYRYLSDRPVLVSEEAKFFTIMIPLI